MLSISATIINEKDVHKVLLQTNNNMHELVIPPRANGQGSSANGGEMLFLALATCYCNDIYREASYKNITIHKVDITVSGEFDSKPGSIAENVKYLVSVEADGSEKEIKDLIFHTDTVAEIHNTIRKGIPVELKNIKTLKKE